MKQSCGRTPLSSDGRWFGTSPPAFVLTLCAHAASGDRFLPAALIDLQDCLHSEGRIEMNVLVSCYDVVIGVLMRSKQDGSKQKAHELLMRLLNLKMT